MYFDKHENNLITDFADDFSLLETSYNYLEPH